ncbi:MAG TPA: acyl-CoA dehydrogenase [Gammaproteobacteria bacterium]|nr:acyl-CoA dehydrogenase [Gammaproteobacteria bacterium]
MSVYSAPLRDMRFWLELRLADAHASRLGEYAELTGDLVAAVLEEAARFAEEVLDPLYRLGDQRGATLENGQVRLPAEIRDAYARFAEGGWVGLPVDTELGGQGLPQLVSVAVNEIWKSANLAFSLCPMLTQGAIETLRRHGSEALKSRFLAKMVAGTWTGTMNLTEPQAGSDLGALRAIAVPEGDHYRLKGRKIFITWGDHDLAENVVHLVLARTPGAPPGINGISMFVVPKRLVAADASIGELNEIATVSIEEKLGIHGSPTCVLSYGDQRGAVAYLVGEEHRGLSYMFTMMNSARLAVGAEGLAMAERGYQQALAYARERVQGSSPTDGGPARILEHPDVRRMLMIMKSGTEAMRGLSYAAAAALDRAGMERATDADHARVALLTPVVKGWCTELAQELASLAIQVHGGVGYVEETGVAQILRDARITTIYEGTTGIQANDLVGRKLLRDRGAALAALLAEIEALLPELAAAEGGLPSSLAALRRGTEACRQAVGFLLERHREDSELAGSVAVNLLLLMGTLLGGWQLARGALAARARLADGGADADWLRAKLVTAEFYAEHLMPRIDAYRATIVSGSRTIMALTEDQLAR